MYVCVENNVIEFKRGIESKTIIDSNPKIPSLNQLNPSLFKWM